MQHSVSSSALCTQLRCYITCKRIQWEKKTKTPADTHTYIHTWAGTLKIILTCFLWEVEIQRQRVKIRFYKPDKRVFFFSLSFQASVLWKRNVILKRFDWVLSFLSLFLLFTFYFQPIDVLFCLWFRLLCASHQKRERESGYSCAFISLLRSAHMKTARTHIYPPGRQRKRMKSKARTEEQIRSHESTIRSKKVISCGLKWSTPTQR